MKMKRTVRSMLGVTLLEIMLVLAIAAMIIVMSVRYYQSATTSQQATASVNQALAIITAMESMGTSSGSFASLTTTDVLNYLGGGSAMTTVNGGAATISGTPTATTFTVQMVLTPPVCSSVGVRIKSTKIPAPDVSTCATDGTLKFTYNKTL